jgi:nickel-dependent lactate racemase
VSGGVRAPTSRVIAADTGIKQSANTMYAGTRSALTTTTCSRESDGIVVMAARQRRTAGNMATPQMTVWTATIATDVTTIRKIFIVSHDDDGES